jgi:hypothetical protein
VRRAAPVPDPGSGHCAPGLSPGRAIAVPDVGETTSSRTGHHQWATTSTQQARSTHTTSTPPPRTTAHALQAR